MTHVCTYVLSMDKAKRARSRGAQRTDSYRDHWTELSCPFNMFCSGTLHQVTDITCVHCHTETRDSATSRASETFWV